MVSFKFCESRKNLIYLFLCFFVISCSENINQNEENVEKKNFSWRLVTTWPKNYPGVGLGPENFAQLVDEMSDGRLKIKVYGNGELIPALEVFDTVSRGTVEMGHGASYYWIGKLPAAQFFTTLPFGLNAQERNAWLHFGGGLELWEKAYEPFNLIPMAGGNTGVQMGGWFNKEINTTEDLKGIRIRMPGLAGEVFTKAGGEAVLMPGSEIFTNLQTGVIDAAEWIGPYNDLTFGFHQVAKYYYYPGWQEPGAMTEFIFNKEAFNELPDDLKAIARTAARAVNQNMMDEYTARNNQALISLIEDHNVILKKLLEIIITFTNIMKNIYYQWYLLKKVYNTMSFYTNTTTIMTSL